MGSGETIIEAAKCPSCPFRPAGQASDMKDVSAGSSRISSNDGGGMSCKRDYCSGGIQSRSIVRLYSLRVQGMSQVTGHKEV